jgi:hypothetical protein
MAERASLPQRWPEGLTLIELLWKNVSGAMMWCV